MITTVTTTTTVALATAATSLTLTVILTLIALLIQKEFISGLEGRRAALISRALNIAIVPLLIVFVASVAIRVFDSLH
ncbi:MAG TPA: hypothetical protein VFT66_18945 [Roseiflexaceae bacterium]|nr:hypothetical protein [Roseiflexaceae bacterium]